MRSSAFRASGQPGERLPLQDADVRYWPAAFDAGEALRLFDELRRNIDWQHEEVVIFGQRRRVPRLVAWHGDPGTSYTYSGTLHEPRPWIPALDSVRTRIDGLTGCTFNSVLLNLYRDGRDGMGWHADDEPELGRDPVIASVSLGAERRFCLRHCIRRESRLDILLCDGSLLLMAGATQHHWVHALPKTTAAAGARINLTLRNIAVR
jgi:alkylated DNA repair dioxygenase AlkB